MSKKSEITLLDSGVFLALNMLYPNVKDYDTSVESMIESGSPVLPTEEQFYDNDTPIHIYKSFDFKNMPVDPSAIKASMNYVEPSPVNSAPVVNSNTVENVSQSV